MRPAIVLRPAAALGKSGLTTQGRSAALRVPSAIVPLEFNLVLNPAHPDFDFDQVQDGEPEPYSLDPRLGK